MRRFMLAAVLLIVAMLAASPAPAEVGRSMLVAVAPANADLNDSQSKPPARLIALTIPPCGSPRTPAFTKKKVCVDTDARNTARTFAEKKPTPQATATHGTGSELVNS